MSEQSWAESSELKDSGTPAYDGEVQPRRPFSGSGIARRWKQFWFEPTSASTLGFCRLAFFGGLLFLQFPLTKHEWTRVPRVFYRPVWPFSVFNAGVPSERLIICLEVLWVCVLALAALGLFTRIAVFASLLLSLYLMGLPNNFGKIGHGDQAMVLTMLILLLARCGDALALDHMIAAGRTTASSPTLIPSSEYRWPIRMVWLLTALVFFAAGITKLVRCGWPWISSDNFSIMLIHAHYFGNPPPTTLGLVIAKLPWLCHGLALGTILLEIGFPLALFGHRLRMTIVPTAFLMQLSIGLLLGVWFYQFLLLYIFWVPWARVGHWLRKSQPSTVEAERYLREADKGSRQGHV